MLQSMGSQRVGHNLAPEWQWTTAKLVTDGWTSKGVPGCFHVPSESLSCCTSSWLSWWLTHNNIMKIVLRSLQREILWGAFFLKNKNKKQTWCTRMTLRDGMGRDLGGGLRMGNTCTLMVDSCQCMAKITTIF